MVEKAHHLFLKDATFDRKRYAELFKMNEQQIALFGLRRGAYCEPTHQRETQGCKHCYLSSYRL